MDYTLDEQMEELCRVIKKELEDGTNPAGIRELMIAQKTLLESIVITHHLENLAAQLENCGGGGCGHHEG